MIISGRGSPRQATGPPRPEAFDSVGVPAAGVTAFFVMWLEVLGGIAVIVGLLTPLVGALLVLALGTASLPLAVVGAGRISADHLLVKRIPWRGPAPRLRRAAL